MAALLCPTLTPPTARAHAPLRARVVVRAARPAARGVLAARAAKAAPNGRASEPEKSPLADFDVAEILTETAAKTAEAWEATEDKPAVVTLALYGFVGLWATAGILKGVDSLPLVPQLLELVGISFSAWFVYRYLIYKQDREELKRVIEELKSKVLP